MTLFKNSVRAIIVLSLAYLIFPQKAHAYIDLGTGSFILQLALAFLLGALLWAKGLWNKIKSSFKFVLSNGNKSRKKVKE